jgi:hypothetical protein
MKTIKSRFLALFSSIGALFASCGGACGVACAASGCCGSYALFGFIGISSSSMKFFEKLTPFFLILTILSLSYAFYKAYKPKDADCCNSENSNCSSDCCSTPKKTIFIQSKSFLWAITIMSAILWTYPYFSKLSGKDSSCNTKTEVLDKASIQCDTSKTGCCSQTIDCSTACSTK